MNSWELGYQVSNNVHVYEKIQAGVQWSRDSDYVFPFVLTRILYMYDITEEFKHVGLFDS